MNFMPDVYVYVRSATANAITMRTLAVKFKDRFYR